ncbi:hypothetical protein CesoFtcFv8_008595 [Champsocephalus esox]|uniref:Uncharacterized protein n=1 Tax=Champsocephalus esox TaxID=159716 RepID=A0AAN8C8C1_9TELE|nr:hypothetical protein CesoFtcFv8_008595 [Champsocephalus esox]
MRLHEKFKNQMTSPGVPMLTEEGREAHPGEEHDTPWRIVKAQSPPAASDFYSSDAPRRDIISLADVRGRIISHS